MYNVRDAFRFYHTPDVNVFIAPGHETEITPVLKSIEEVAKTSKFHQKTAFMVRTCGLVGTKIPKMFQKHECAEEKFRKYKSELAENESDDGDLDV